MHLTCIAYIGFFFHFEYFSIPSRTLGWCQVLTHLIFASVLRVLLKVQALVNICFNCLHSMQCSMTNRFIFFKSTPLFQWLQTFLQPTLFFSDTYKYSFIIFILGLGSILFAINIDRPELNAIKAATGLDSLLSRSSAKPVTIQSLVNSEACPIASSRYSSSVGMAASLVKCHQLCKLISHWVGCLSSTRHCPHLYC
jgi:hypothetical protein